MPSTFARIAGPLLVGALAGAGAIVATLLTREPPQRAIAPVQQPLIAEGWWSSEQSSPLAHAHPAVVIVDAATDRVVDSWDRRTRSRVPNVTAERRAEWPATGLLVLDANTGDLLTVIAHAGEGAGMPTT